VGFLMALPFAPAGYLERLATIANIDADATGSAQIRQSDNVAAVRLVLARPLIGAGIGMSTLAMNEERGDTWTKIHSVYLEYAVDLGLPGLLLFLLLLLSCLKRVRSVRHRSATVPRLHELSFLAEGIEISLLAFAVSALFSPVAYHFYFYYVAGLTLAAATVHAKTVARGNVETSELRPL
jgi:O-antigen ligase